MKIIGHRGAAGLAVENTIDSIKAAIAADVWGIELDLRLTADRHFVVCHDSNLRRVTGVNLEIKKATLEQVKSVVHNNTHAILTAREAIRHILRANSSTYIILEIKGKKWVKEAHKLLDGFALADKKRLILASFNLKDLRDVQKQHPTIKFLYHFHALPAGLALLSAKRNHAWGVGINVRYFSRLMVLASKNLQLTTVVFTVNSPKKAKSLQRMGVDYIITDFPDRFAILSQ